MSDFLGRVLLIRPQERGQVIYFLLLFFIIGCGLAIGRYSTDVLFFKRYGIENLPYMYMLHGLLLMVTTAFYAAYADKLAPEKLLVPMGVVLVALLAGVWVMMTVVQWEQIYPIYFLIYESASEIFVVHCTLYLSRSFDVLQSKRLVPVIFGGWQVGAITGSLILTFVAPYVGVQNMPFLWLCLVAATVFIITSHHRRVGVSPYHRVGRKGRNSLGYVVDQLNQGVKFMRTSPLLKAMSFALFFMVITFYVLCYSVNRVYSAAFPDEVSLSVFFGRLGVVTGVTALLLQIFVTNRLIRRWGVRKMNLVFPSLAVVGFTGLLLSFTIPAAVFASIIKDALMPAIRNPVRALFFTALPSYLQGRAHAVSIGIVLPLALVVAGFSLVIAQSLDTVVHFLLLGFMTGGAYWLFSRQMNMGYVQAIVSTLRDKLFVPDERFTDVIKGDEQQVFQLLARAANHEEPEIRFMAAKTLMDIFPDKAPPLVLQVLDGLTAPLRDQLIALLIPLEPPELKDYLFREVQGGDEHLKATALSALFHIRAGEAKDLVIGALENSNPRICSAGIFGALNYPIDELAGRAKQQWRGLLKSGDKGQVLAALNLLARWPQSDFIEELRPHFYSDDKRVVLAAIGALHKWPEEAIPGLEDIFVELIGSIEPQIRAGIARHLQRLPDRARLAMAKALIEDDHPDVRLWAARVLFPMTTPIGTMEAWVLKNRHSPKALQVVLSLLLSRRAPRDAWERIARHFASKAGLFHAAYMRLQLQTSADADDPLALARIVLHERAMQTLDLSLYSAMQYEDKNILSVIRAGVKVKDRQQWAATIEAVRYIEDKTLAQSLTTVLEIMSGESSHDVARKWRFHDVSSVLQWIKEQGDPWLTQCVPSRASL